ncbi:Crp/Fnr family transcriptional regulator [Sphingobacteriaceae bacterium WQ 2009]|uniref:Crp/Fnr family transcriptional regulator n=1 Tax=Rhinopithecimicrobium faecis TaxID=2820698 RepID=A0A8T4H7X7_9SPHI|nr:Crp/Fnr family transcriptional regulator [Sphingobacteriaceae bacterium WQ 2009]
MDLKAIILSIHPLQEDDYNQFAAIIQPRIVAKNTRLIEAGKVDHRFYFIQEGITRVYYETAERTINLVFPGPGETILSLNSYSLQSAGYEYIETLTECLLFEVDAIALKKLYQTNLDLANWGRKLAEIEFIKAEKRLMNHLFKSAQERYTELLLKYPALIQNIKLGHIASYLGVSQVTLSRIRAVKS